MLDIVDVLPAGGVTRTPTSDLDLDRSRALRLNHDAWRETLRDLAPASEFNAYVWLAFACANEARDVTRDSIFAPTAAFTRRAADRVQASDLPQPRPRDRCGR